MTKEELKKEVEEYLENECCENVCTCDEVEECKKGIRIRCMSFNHKKELVVNFAEPREKRIAELEKEVDLWRKASENNSYKAFQLEQENAELKEQNTNLQEMLKTERSVTCKEEYLKKVTELEAQIEELKASYEQLLDKNIELEHLIKTQDRKLRQQSKVCDEAINRVETLVKENTELKQKYAKECEDVAFVVTNYAKQLTKAKELLKNIIRVTWGEGWNYSLDWKVKAEEFISSSENPNK